HLGDRLSLELDLQRLAVVAPALADLARHVDVRQELHFDLQDAIALAGLAAAALDVEGEAAGPVATQARVWHRREQLADRRKPAGIGGRIGAWGAPDRRLIDLDHLVQMLETLDPIVLASPLASPIDRLSQR